MANAALLGVLLAHAGFRSQADLPRLREEAVLVERLGLADLCLALEAWHTRHPALSDRHTPFQSHPLALEHFPSGSVIGPPEIINNCYEALD